MTTQQLKPKAWAIRLTQVLDATLAGSPDRFPVKVKPLAMDYSRQVFKDDPVVRVEGASLGSFEGCLKRIPHEGGWGILHNTGVSPGRARFTLAHEFGHYLLHRMLIDGEGGMSCTPDDIACGSANGPNMEKEADEFASWLLMPLNDFRKQLHPRDAADLHILSQCANRYGTSLLATTLKWLSYTERRAALITANDDFVKWAVSSGPALRTGAFLRTRGTPPIEVHPSSNLATGREDRDGTVQAPEVWFGEQSREMTLIPDGYRFGMSLVILGDPPDRAWDDDNGDDGNESRLPSTDKHMR